MQLPALPLPARWLDAADGAYLQWHFGCIASVKARDGKIHVSINRRGGPPITGSAPSVPKGKIYVERWLAARDWHPIHPDVRRAAREARPRPPPLPRGAIPTVLPATPMRLRPSDFELIYQGESRTISFD